MKKLWCRDLETEALICHERVTRETRRPGTLNPCSPRLAREACISPTLSFFAEI